MVGTAAVDLNRVLASRRAPADHRCEPTRSEPPALSRTFSGGPWCCRVAKHIAAAPHCFDVMIAAGCLGELFAQIADKNVDDLELRRAHHTVEGRVSLRPCPSRAKAGGSGASLENLGYVSSRDQSGGGLAHPLRPPTRCCANRPRYR